ncbi:MAG TPA: GIY-YIG nuclease family protein, partial [Coriobacteriia bacterium]|nr:GIY-YIG nuclease family protein [Coriobacteriia bacterium]
MAWVYMLRCSDGSYYVGSTTNLPARLIQHNNGGGATYTERRRPVVLVWAMEFDNVRDAFLAEKQIQNWSRAKREALIEGRLDDLPLLSRGRTGWMKRGVTGPD